MWTRPAQQTELISDDAKVAFGSIIADPLQSLNRQLSVHNGSPLVARERQVWGAFRTFPTSPDPESLGQIFGRQVEG
jgi:hypothetical protein